MYNNIKCDECGNEMIQTKINEEFTLNDKTIELKGINAYVCHNCGNKFIEQKDAELIENLLEATKNINIDILNLEETADLLKVSNQTIYNMIRDKRLKAYKVGREWRFMKKDIESFMNESSNIAMAAKGGIVESEDIEKLRKRLED